MKGGGGRKIPLIQRKDRDEDLLLFRELHKREKDRIASLLQPVSDEFEPNATTGNHALYRIASGKKGPGYEFLGESDHKNDYDWLKTPPATPLFPSLELEANDPELAVFQREIPILQPLSRFAAGNSGAPKEMVNGRLKSPKTIKPKVPVMRSITPGQRPSISTTEIKTTKATTTLNQKTPPLTTDHLNSKKTNMISNTTSRSTNQKEIRPVDFLTSNLAKTAETDAKTKPRSRGVSPSMRSTIAAQIPGFSNEPPPNLRTSERSTSATRGRPNPTVVLTDQPAAQIPGFSNEPPPNLRTTERSTSATRGRPNPTGVLSHQPAARTRRQSCSPSVTRGRKVEQPNHKQQLESEGNNNLTTQKGRNNNILGSRMVEKVMSARKSGAHHHEERSQTKPKPRGSISQATAPTSTGVGKMMQRSSLDIALKHMDVKRDRNNSRHFGTNPGKSSTGE